jgi:site-specific DNA-methyltransferase (adenine-specific)
VSTGAQDYGSEDQVVKPYYADESVTLYLGDMREVLPALSVTADCIIADPPYAETSLAWDRWPDGWVEVAASVTRSMWCFGSLRMFGERWQEFTAARWKLSQDVIWEKHNGSGAFNDRFKRVHEQPAHWYRGEWGRIYHETPTTPDATARTVRRKFKPAHWGELGISAYASEDGGPRLMRSVIAVPSMHGRALHPTEKPIALLDPLIEYACKPGGLIVVPFVGSGSDLDAARQSGRRAIGVELHEPYAETAAKRLSQGILEIALPSRNRAGIVRAYECGTTEPAKVCHAFVVSWLVSGGGSGI